MYSSIDELQVLLRLPFSTNADPAGAAHLCPEILWTINDCGDMAEGTCTADDLSQAWKIFFRNFDRVRRRQHGGVSPLSVTDTYRVLDQFMQTTGFDSAHIAEVRDRLRIDPTVALSELASLALFIIDRDDEGAYKAEDLSKIYNNWHRILTQESQYDAATALIVSFLFSVSRELDGNLEVGYHHYDALYRACLTPGSEYGRAVLERGITFLLERARSGEFVITERKLESLPLSENRHWKALIRNGESQTCEFKSTLCLNLKTTKKDRNIEHAVIKTIAAFLNSRGGILFIGVDDGGAIVGLDPHFESDDKFQQHFANMLRRLEGPTLSHISSHIVQIDGVAVFVVKCRNSAGPVYVKGNNDSQDFYVRVGTSTNRLGLSDAIEYVRENFDSSR